MSENAWLNHIKIVSDNDKAWFYSKELRSLIEVNILDGKARCLLCVSGNNNPLPYNSLLFCSGKIFMLPYDSDELIIYDLKDGNIRKAKLIDKKEKCGFTGGVIRGEYIYFFGSHHSQICKYDFINDQVKLLDQLSVDNCSSKQWFWTEAFMVDGIIYLVTLENGLITIDKNDCLSHIQLGGNVEKWNSRNVILQNNQFKSLYVGEDLQLHISDYDLHGNIQNDMTIEFPSKWEGNLFIHAEFSRGKWIIFPYKTNDIYMIDSNDGKVEKIRRNVAVTEQDIVFTDAIVVDDQVVAIDQITSEIIKVDVPNNSINSVPISFDEVGKCGMDSAARDIMFERKDVLYEHKNWFSLENFINSITNK